MHKRIEIENTYLSIKEVFDIEEPDKNDEKLPEEFDNFSQLYRNLSPNDQRRARIKFFGLDPLGPGRGPEKDNAYRDELICHIFKWTPKCSSRKEVINKLSRVFDIKPRRIYYVLKYDQAITNSIQRRVYELMGLSDAVILKSGKVDLDSNYNYGLVFGDDQPIQSPLKHLIW